MPPKLDEALLPYPADLPDPRVSHYLDEFKSRYPQIFSAVTHDLERLSWIRTIFASSRFLSEELLQHPDWILTVDDLQSTLATEKYKARFEEFLRERRVESATAQELALFRRKELLRITLRDRLQFAPLFVITEELSNLADAILDRALARVTQDLQSRYGAPGFVIESGDIRPTLFSVIALGKLGGRN